MYFFWWIELGLLVRDLPSFAYRYLYCSPEAPIEVSLHCVIYHWDSSFPRTSLQTYTSCNPLRLSEVVVMYSFQKQRALYSFLTSLYSPYHLALPNGRIIFPSALDLSEFLWDILPVLLSKTESPSYYYYILSLYMLIFLFRGLLQYHRFVLYSVLKL